MRITIAGASGFVGRAFVEHFLQFPSLTIRALGRGKQAPTDWKKRGVEWAQTDLFSLESTRVALKDTDIAIYLVHSMAPSTRLFQGSFADVDLLLADNFVQACKETKAKQIIYLGGLMPVDRSSKHLSSRIEVEDVLKSAGLPFTIFRAGMVAGAGGSSFELLRNLVKNLPAMLLPRWTQARTQVIYIEDVVRVFADSVSNEKYFDQTVDLVNGESLCYEDLIRQTCATLKRNPPLLRAPINSTGFSKLWVSFFGRTDYALVSPLIDSLLCELPQNPPVPLIAPLIQVKTFREMLGLIQAKPRLPVVGKRPKPVFDNTVRSIQRLPSLPNWSCSRIAGAYVDWLPLALWGLLKTNFNSAGTKIYFSFLTHWIPLLVLERISTYEGDENRVGFRITGGLLARPSQAGWLEFRQIAAKKFTLASIHEFVPTLPWFIYRFTQAVVHRSVMLAFGRELEEQNRNLKS